MLLLLLLFVAVDDSSTHDVVGLGDVRTSPLGISVTYNDFPGEHALITKTPLKR